MISGPPRWFRIHAATAAGMALVVLHALWMRAAFRGNCVDDAYISFRYAENLLRGHGLVFNVGERVEGYSNFLWTLLLAPLGLWFEDLTRPAQILGLAAAAATVPVASRALRRVLGVDSAWTSWGLVLLLASSGYFAAWSVSGLETGFYGLLLLLAWARFVEEREAGSASRSRVVSALLVAALALTRPEGVFVALAALGLHGWLVVRRREAWTGRRAWMFPAIVVGAVLAYEAWRFAYYGPHPFPLSVRAKVGASPAEIQRGLHYVAAQFLWPYAVLLLGSVCCLPPRTRLAGMSGMGLLLGYVLFVALVGGDWSEGRFFGPLVPLGAVLFAGGVSALPALCHPSPDRKRPSLFVATVAYAALTFFVTSVQREHAFRVAFAPKDASRILIGRWLREAAPPDARLAVRGAGQIPYYSRLWTHDMLGLNDPRIGDRPHKELGRGVPGHEAYDVAYTLEVVDPDILVDPHGIPGMLEHPKMAEYTELPFRENLVLVRRGLPLASLPALPPGGLPP